MPGRRILASLVACAVVALAPAQESRFHTDRPNPRLLPLPKEEGAFSFVVFGDRTQGVPEGLKTLAQAVDDVNLLAPDLVMTVGDLVQGYNDTQAWTAEAREYRAVMARLSMPWFPVAGNHDIYYRGKDRPKNEHEGNFEKHFGPLWYAFEHKNAWFVVLHSDEGDPSTGKRDFGDPATQKMSDAQFSWLSSTLERARGADHVFVFLHHPRWNGGGYGDDWSRVHEVLRKAGNVTAVFAGHIHRMTWGGKRDGIEYFTLAATGGSLDADVPKAGFLHEFHVVTVRKGRMDVAAIPVGAVMDPRVITKEVSDDVALLSKELAVTTTKPVVLDSKLGADGLCEVEIRNPARRPVEVTCLLECADPSFRFSPDHQHVVVPAGEARAITFLVTRKDGPFDPAFVGVEAVVQCDYLGAAIRISLPKSRAAIRLKIPTPEAAGGASDGALRLDGKRACLRIAPESLAVPDGPFTVEAWMRASSLTGRRGLVNKTENAEFGIFVGEGKPTFSVFLDGKYSNAAAAAPLLETNRWHHVAGVFDGAQVRLYVDGKLVAFAPGAGSRRRNALPLLVGADPDGSGKPGSFFEGLVDDVRISAVARYAADFAPPRRHTSDERTVLLLHLDADFGPWTLDASGRAAHADRLGGATCVPAER